MDSRLREIERRASSGDKSAQVALLSARVRAGEIPSNRLQLAAFLGDETALQVVTSETGLRPSKYTGRWVRGLIRFDPITADYVVLVAHQVLAGVLPGLPRPAHNHANYVNARWSRMPDMRALAEAAEAWMRSRTEERADLVLTLERDFERDRDAAVAASYWWSRNLPISRLGELVRGRATEVAEECFRTAAEWRNATLAKHGRETIEELMRRRITSVLVEWSLRSG